MLSRRSPPGGSLATSLATKGGSDRLPGGADTLLLRDGSLPGSPILRPSGWNSRGSVTPKLLPDERARRSYDLLCRVPKGRFCTSWEVIDFSTIFPLLCDRR